MELADCYVTSAELSAIYTCALTISLQYLCNADIMIITAPIEYNTVVCVEGNNSEHFNTLIYSYSLKLQFIIAL